MHLGGPEARLPQLARELLDFEFRRGKHYDTLRRHRPEQMLEYAGLLIFMTHECRLVDFFGRARHRYLDLGRILKYRPGQLLDLGRHRGREHHSLPLPGQLLHDLHYVIVESHIEHAVGLVENEKRHLRQVDVAHAHMRQQTARGWAITTSAPDSVRAAAGRTPCRPYLRRLPDCSPAGNTKSPPSDGRPAVQAHG